MRLKWTEMAALLACLGATCVQTAHGQNSDLRSQYERSQHEIASLASEFSDDSVDSYNGYNTFETADSYGCDTCNIGGCDSCGAGCGSGCGLMCRPLQFFGGAEYIYARANFSEALAYVDQDIIAGGETYIEYDFDYKSSYSLYGGIRLLDCGGAIVFDYDRYRSSSEFLALDDVSNTVSTNIFGPFEIDAPQGGRLQGSADVDLKSYDLSFEKTIPLGGPLGCCGDACGDGCCGDGCCNDGCCGADPCGCGCCWCPAWDITWSAGLRYADVDWSRGATALDVSSIFVDSYNTRMQFEGIGARVGLEGRRYFGCRGAFSLFARGDWSLLAGDMDIETLVTNTSGTAFHRNGGHRVIPVTEIEAGGTIHIRRCIQLSAGYFISAWHDLGMREEYSFGNFQIANYDDANILSFDGFFARAEMAF